jgi:HSP20 family molecular chaperone IbpA
MTRSSTLFDELFKEFSFPFKGITPVNFGDWNRFPYFNIEQKNKKVTYVFALAGYNKDCIEAIVDNGVLNLKGFQDVLPDDIKLLYQGISSKQFDVRIPRPLGDKFIGQEATFKDGMLRITFDLELKDDRKTKLEIS